MSSSYHSSSNITLLMQILPTLVICGNQFTTTPDISIESIWLPPARDKVKINVGIAYNNAEKSYWQRIFYKIFNYEFLLATHELDTAGCLDPQMRLNVKEYLEYSDEDLRSLEATKGGGDRIRLQGGNLHGKPNNISWTAKNFLDETKYIASSYFNYVYLSFVTSLETIVDILAKVHKAPEAVYV